MDQVHLFVEDLASYPLVSFKLAKEGDAAVSDGAWPAEFPVAVHESVSESSLVGYAHLVGVMAKAVIPAGEPGAEVAAVAPLEYHQALLVGPVLSVVSKPLRLGLPFRVQWSSIDRFDRAPR